MRALVATLGMCYFRFLTSCIFGGPKYNDLFSAYNAIHMFYRLVANFLTHPYVYAGKKFAKYAADTRKITIVSEIVDLSICTSK